MTKKQPLVTIQQCVRYAFNNNPKWMKYQNTNHSTPKCATDWWMKVHSPRFPIECINKQSCMQVIREMQVRGKQNGTINRVLTNINSALNFCYEDEVIDIGPWSLNKYKLPEPKGRKVAYEIPEVMELSLKAAAYGWHDLSDIIQCSALTGARQGEMLRLKAEDISFSENCIYFNNRKKLDGTIRPVPIESKVVLPILQERCDSLSHDDRVFGDDWTSRYQLGKRYNEIRDAVFDGKKKYVFHVLRNTFISALAKLGYSAVEICSIMDHSSIQVTERYLASFNKTHNQMIRDMSTLIPDVCGV